MSKQPSVAYVGLGIMGKPAATHLLKAGYALRVYARRPEATAELAALGATVCESAAAAADGADFAISNVSDTPDVLEVVLGENGFASTLAAGSVVLDMSTIAPAAARQLASELGEKGVGFVDAPVSGGQAGAEAGTLAFMCGASAADYAKALPLMEAMGASQVHVGGPGAGQVAKCVNQVVIGATVDAIAESFALARKLDVDPAKVREAIAGGFAGSKVLEVHARRIIDESFEPGFKAKLHYKDINIALDAAAEAGVELPSAAAFRDRLAKVIEHGMGELDSSVAARALEL